MVAEVSIVVPAYQEGESLLSTMEAIVAAAGAVPAPVEIVLVVQAPSGQSARVAGRAARANGIRLLLLDRPGKFAALRAAVDVTDGSILVFADADIGLGHEALRSLLVPIKAEAFDVAVARPVRGRVASGTSSLVADWTRVTFEAWHRLRTGYPPLRWALPGTLYAIRRELFPDTILVPLIDDASIGLGAVERGARVAYVPEAVVHVDAPPGYAAWCRQKVRTRQGWALLRQRRPHEVDALMITLRAMMAEVLADERRAVRLLAWHDRQLRRIATLTASEEAGRAGVWRPVRPSQHSNQANARHGR